jgi:hypothetical protein
MKKSELKSGMLVITRDGHKGLIMLGTPEGDSIVSDGTRNGIIWKPLSQINEDLTSEYGGGQDVVEVWSYGCNMNGASLKMEYRTLLWKRDDTEKYKLNSEYTAVLDRDNRTVKVGCQTFEFYRIRELYELIYEKKAK